MKLNKTLVRTFARRGTFPVSRITMIHNIHSLHYFSNRRKALLVQKGVALFARVDEYLCGTAVGARSGEDDCAAFIAHAHGVILQVGAAPFGLDGGIAIDAKLDHKTGQHAENTTIIPESKTSKFLADRVTEKIKRSLLDSLTPKNLPRNVRRCTAKDSYQETIDSARCPFRLELDFDSSGLAFLSIQIGNLQFHNGPRADLNCVAFRELLGKGHKVVPIGS